MSLAVLKHQQQEGTELRFNQLRADVRCDVQFCCWQDEDGEEGITFFLFLLCVLEWMDIFLGWERSGAEGEGAEEKREERKRDNGADSN